MANELATFVITGGSIPGAKSSQLDAVAGPATTAGRVLSVTISVNTSGAYTGQWAIQDQSLQDRSFAFTPNAAVLNALFAQLQSGGQSLVTSQAPGATITFTAG